MKFPVNSFQPIVWLLNLCMLFGKGFAGGGSTGALIYPSIDMKIYIANMSYEYMHHYEHNDTFMEDIFYFCLYNSTGNDWYDGDSDSWYSGHTTMYFGDKSEYYYANYSLGYMYVSVQILTESKTQEDGLTEILESYNFKSGYGYCLKDKLHYDSHYQYYDDFKIKKIYISDTTISVKQRLINFSIMLGVCLGILGFSVIVLHYYDKTDYQKDHMNTIKQFHAGHDSQDEEYYDGNDEHNEHDEHDDNDQDNENANANGNENGNAVTAVAPIDNNGQNSNTNNDNNNNNDNNQSGANNNNNNSNTNNNNNINNNNNNNNNNNDNNNVNKGRQNIEITNTYSQARNDDMPKGMTGVARSGSDESIDVISPAMEDGYVSDANLSTNNYDITPQPPSVQQMREQQDATRHQNNLNINNNNNNQNKNDKNLKKDQSDDKDKNI